DCDAGGGSAELPAAVGALSAVAASPAAAVPDGAAEACVSALCGGGAALAAGSAGGAPADAPAATAVPDGPATSSSARTMRSSPVSLTRTVKVRLCGSAATISICALRSSAVRAQLISSWPCLAQPASASSAAIAVSPVK